MSEILVGDDRLTGFGKDMDVDASVGQAGQKLPIGDSSAQHRIRVKARLHRH
jgi:hypothetical protein